jgi:hypothetical protein
MAARWAAPVFPREPATIRTCPKSPLCESSARGWTSARRSSSRHLDPRAVDGARLPGNAEVRHDDIPAHCAPGDKTNGSLGAANVTVSVASTQVPIGSRVSADIPLGRSTDTTGISRLLIPVTIVAVRPVRADLRPVPNNASTATSQDSRMDAHDSQVCSSVISTAAIPSRFRIRG